MMCAGVIGRGAPGSPGTADPCQTPEGAGLALAYGVCNPDRLAKKLGERDPLRFDRG